MRTTGDLRNTLTLCVCVCVCVCVNEESGVLWVLSRGAADVIHSESDHVTPSISDKEAID